MHIPRSQRGQNGTVIILINGFTLVGPGGYRWILLQLLSSHHMQAAEQMDGPNRRFFCLLFICGIY